MPPAAKAVVQNAPAMPDLAGFQARSELDERAMQALSELSDEAQHIVITLVDSQPCRNVSAVTWSKVKMARDRPYEAKAEYLRQHLDEAAMSALQQLPSTAQHAVLAQVDVLNSRNLSAVCWSKIKACSGMTPAAMPGSMAGGMGMRMGIHIPAPAAPRPVMQQVMQQAPQPGAFRAAAKASELGLDEEAILALHRLQLHEQSDMLEKIGNMSCRNPSAVLISKIQELRGAGNVRIDRSRSPAMLGMRATTPLMTMPAAPNPMSALGYGAPAGFGMVTGAAAFRHMIDDRATQALAGLPPQEAHMVLTLVSQGNCKNPSAVAWTKVKMAKESAVALRAEYFEKVMDERCATALRELPQEMQEAVIADIDVLASRNISAVVWSKVKAAMGSGGAVVAGAVTHKEDTQW
eukprot:NODE_7687_length_1557_cov_12.370629.p1 GENE.NODE_7687_length_1557_cov_12.370629~~NODE_7687_length_1557_cov_12.370629.p1  ORF type:complete len:407 (-),score=137.11 NODE_7687_length_1557_cov_12.370629:256-1476(-)